LLSRFPSSAQNLQVNITVWYRIELEMDLNNYNADPAISLPVHCCHSNTCDLRELGVGKHLLEQGTMLSVSEKLP
jgi:hypothetical protein